jgi:hypothetical protein
MFWRRTHGAVKLQRDSLKHRGGSLRANGVLPFVQQACRCATFGSLLRHDSISVPFEGVPTSLCPGLGNGEWGETGIF